VTSPTRRRRPGRTTPPTGRRRPARRSERGSATAETVVVIPVVMLLVLLIVQFAVWQHALHVAQAAAAQGLAAARVQDGTAADGRTAAEAVLDRAGRGPLVNPAVSVDRGAATVTVTVDATAEQVVPGLRLPVHARAVGAAEPAPPTTGTGGP
jgi:Flp pilus assembly protein TadG